MKKVTSEGDEGRGKNKKDLKNQRFQHIFPHLPVNIFH